MEDKSVKEELHDGKKDQDKIVPTEMKKSSDLSSFENMNKPKYSTISASSTPSTTISYQNPTKTDISYASTNTGCSQSFKTGILRTHTDAKSNTVKKNVLDSKRMAQDRNQNHTNNKKLRMSVSWDYLKSESNNYAQVKAFHNTQNDDKEIPLRERRGIDVNNTTVKPQYSSCVNEGETTKHNTDKISTVGSEDKVKKFSLDAADTSNEHSKYLENMPASRALIPSTSISPTSSSSSFSSNAFICPSTFPSPRVPPAPPCTPNSDYLASHIESSSRERNESFHESVTPLASSHSQHSTFPIGETSPTSSADPSASGHNRRFTADSDNLIHNQYHNEDFSEWATGDKYRLLRILGRGSYGEVAQAKVISNEDSSTHYQSLQYDSHDDSKHPDKDVAIKRITSAFDQEVDAVRIYREIHILRRLRGHSCIIQLLDVVPPADFESFNDLYLVFECKA